MTDELVAATDGSALGNPGPGGWCWWVSDECWAAGSNKHTTNNIMEIQAVYELLVSTREAGLAGHRLEIQADSRYVIDALTKWIFSWKDNEWMTAKKEPVKNRELFEATFEEMQGRAVRLSWVRGHMGHRGNEAADKRARLAATQAKAGKTVLLGPGA